MSPSENSLKYPLPYTVAERFRTSVTVSRVINSLAGARDEMSRSRNAVAPWKGDISVMYVRVCVLLCEMRRRVKYYLTLYVYVCARLKNKKREKLFVSNKYAGDKRRNNSTILYDGKAEGTSCGVIILFCVHTRTQHARTTR